nr:hypothetical protein [Tanacetum cinerariifolium]
IGDAYRASASEAGYKPVTPEDLEDPALVFRTGLRAGDACTMPSSVKSYLESTLLLARVTGFPQRHLADSVSSFDRGLVDIVHEYDYLWSRSLKVNEARVAKCHDEEVAGLKGRIVELEDEVKHVNDDFAVTIESNSVNYAQVAFYKAEKEKLMENLPLLFKSVLEFPKAKLKLDKDVAMKVADEAAALSMKSWPYFL